MLKPKRTIAKEEKKSERFWEIALSISIFLFLFLMVLGATGVLNA